MYFLSFKLGCWRKEEEVLSGIGKEMYQTFVSVVLSFVKCLGVRQAVLPVV